MVSPKLVDAVSASPTNARSARRRVYIAHMTIHAPRAPARLTLTRSVVPAVALCFASGCTFENKLNTEETEPAPFETGDVYVPPVDSGETATNESVDTTVPASCDDNYFPALAVPQLEDCFSEGTAVGTFTPVIEWTNTDPGDTYTTPVVGQLTDDNGNGRIDDGDTPDVVVANTSGVLWAISGDGTTLWSAGSLGGEPMTAAIGDLDGDGWPDVAGSGSSASIAVHGEDGSTLWSNRTT
ncbi:MAG: VCBS repeat-containing protein, partial [Myxococcales bacterium]|nr:VCBS repeat-containing protein [Myxococcales bacterium]